MLLNEIRICFKSRKRFNSPAGYIKTSPSALYYFLTVYMFLCPHFNIRD